MGKRKALAAAKGALQRTLVAICALASTVLLFFALSVINEIAGGERPDTDIRSANTLAEKPPQDVLDEPEPEPEEPEEPEEPPPELEQDAVEELTLSQLEAAANAATGFGAVAGDFSIDLSKALGGGAGWTSSSTPASSTRSRSRSDRTPRSCPLRRRSSPRPWRW